MIQEEDPAVTAIAEAMTAAEKAHQAIAVSAAPNGKIERHSMRAPSMAIPELRERIVRLAASLQDAADTEAAHVAGVMGLTFTPELLAIKEGEAAGVLNEGWPYSVNVYKAAKNAPGKQVRINVQLTQNADPRNSARRLDACTFDLKPFADELAILGYKGSETTLPYMEQWSFTRSSEKNGLTFYVSTELYRADDGTSEGRRCVAAVVIAAGPYGSES